MNENQHIVVMPTRHVKVAIRALRQFELSNDPPLDHGQRYMAREAAQLRRVLEIEAEAGDKWKEQRDVSHC